MAKILTVALVIVMLVVGFGVGLVSSPFIITSKLVNHRYVWANIQKTGVIKVGTDPTWPPYQMLNNETQQDRRLRS